MKACQVGKGRGRVRGAVRQGSRVRVGNGGVGWGNVGVRVGKKVGWGGVGWDGVGLGWGGVGWGGVGWGRVRVGKKVGWSRVR